MKSVGRRLLSSVCALALAADGGAGVTAQDKKGDGKAVAVESNNSAAAVDVTAADQMSAAFQVFSEEIVFDTRLVEGAPLSADIVSETIQTLPDGKRIVQRSEGRICRDSKGRTRSERTYWMGGSNGQKQVISIIDPVAKVGYRLDPETRIARENVYLFTEMGVLPADLSAFTPPFNTNAMSHQHRGVIIPGFTTNLIRGTGKRMIEGVECDGARSVTTIPVGAIGNKRPIEAVEETWRSPELKMMILFKRSDPRFGKSTRRVTNIVRSEPDAALFQLPSGYTIIDSQAKKVEVDVKEFEEMRGKLEEAQKKAEGARKPDDQ